jgi:hypothetical protein
MVDTDCLTVDSNSNFMSFSEFPMGETVDWRSLDSAVVMIQRPRERYQCAGRAEHRSQRHFFAVLKFIANSRNFFEVNGGDGPRIFRVVSNAIDWLARDCALK